MVGADCDRERRLPNAQVADAVNDAEGAHPTPLGHVLGDLLDDLAAVGWQDVAECR